MTDPLSSRASHSALSATEEAETFPEVCPCASVHSDGEPRMGVTREDAAEYADPECRACHGTGLRDGGEAS